MSYQIQFRRDTAANWTSSNPILAQAEMGVELVTGKFKIGDGINAWNALAYGGLTGPAGADGISAANAPLSYNSGTKTLSIQQSDATHDGYLTQGDWATFNNKEPAITAGTTAQYLRGDKSLSTFASDVLGVVLTGLSLITSTPVVAADTVLAALGKIQSQINLFLIFTFATNSASPNATIPVLSMTATNAATDVDVAIVPKGQGSFSLQVADGNTTGGNKRGLYAVDLQLQRLANTQVANGTGAFVVGARNTASAANAVATGLACVASNTSSTAMGNGCVASGANSFAAGNGNVSAGNGGAAFGASSAASGINSFVHGLQGSAFNIQARHVYSSGWHQVAGDAQYSRWRVKAATVDATPTVMTIDGAAATTTTRINLQLNNVYYFKGQIIGKQTAVGVATGVGCWTFTGMVMTGTTAGSIILVGAPTITAVSNTGTWGTPTITVDTTNGALIFTVTGKAATTIRWGATIETEEIIYA